MFHNRNSEFSERRIIVATNPHFSYSICRPEKRNADSRMTETLKSSCPTPNINHMPDYADKSAIANDILIIEDVSDKEDTKTPEENTNHMPDQYADKTPEKNTSHLPDQYAEKCAIESDLFIEDV